MYSVVGQKRRFSEKGRVISLAAFFFLLPIVLYMPQILNGESIISGDGLLVLFSGDALRESLLEGEIPLWSPAIAFGEPFAELNNHCYSPIFIICSFLPILLRLPFYLGMHYAIAAVSTFLLLRQLGCRKSVSLSISIIYLFTIHMGGMRKEHCNLIAVSTYVPLVTLWLHKYAKSGKLSHLLISSICMALQYYSGFMQYTIYADLFYLAFLLYTGIRQKRAIKSMLAHIMLWGIIYIMLISAHLLPTLLMVFQQASSSTGSKMEYNTFIGCSLHPITFISMLFPEIFGGNIHAALLQFNASSGMDIELLIGAPCLALLITGIFIKKKGKGFYYGAMLCLILYACLGNIPVLGKTVYHIPILNMFRLPSRVYFLVTFCMMLCIAITLEQVLDGRLQLKSIHIVHAALFLLMAALAVLYYSVPWKAEWGIGERRPFSEVFMVPFAGYVVYLGVYYVILASKNTEILTGFSHGGKSNAVLFSLVLVTVCQLFPYYYASNSCNYKEKIKLPAIILQDDAELYKVMDAEGITGLSVNYAYASSIHSANGYTNFNLPQAYMLLSHVDSAPLNCSGLYYGFSNYASNLVQDNDVLSMLGIKYILLPHDEEKPLQEFQAVKLVLGTEREPILQDQAAITVYPGEGYQLAYWEIPKLPQGGYILEFSMEASCKPNWLYADINANQASAASLISRFSPASGTQKYKCSFILNDSALNNPVLRIVCADNCEISLSDVTLRMVDVETSTPYKLVTADDDYIVYQNLNAKPLLSAAAQVVGITPSSVSDIYVNTAFYNLLDCSYVTGINKQYDFSSVHTDISNIVIQNNQVSAHVETDDTTFIQMSQTYYNGWNAYIDGQKTELYEVNGSIQGMFVPPGIHEISFCYQPTRIYVGFALSLSGLLICACICFFHGRRVRSFIKGGK